MKRIIIVANPDSMRAFRLGSRFQTDRIHFELDEIPISDQARTARPWQDFDHRVEEMAAHINELMATEEANSWAIAAPFGLVTHLLSSIEPAVKSKLDDARIEDLTSLSARQIAHLFSPTQVAA